MFDKTRTEGAHMTTALADQDHAFDDLAEDIISGFTGITRRKAELLRSIARFDKHGLARRFGASTTARWLVHRLGLSETTAHEYVKVARAMLVFLHMAEAFAEGSLNYSKVRLILPHLTRESECALVEMGVEMGYHELEIALLKWRKKGGDGESYVRLKVRRGGRVRMWADFSPAEGAQVMAALKLGELAYHDVDLDALERDDDGRVNDAAVDAELRERESTASPSGFGLPLGKALLGSFMGMVNIVRTQPRSSLRTPGAHVNIVMTTDGRAYLPNNLGAPTGALKNFLSNAEYRVSRVDEKGLVLNTGRSQRLATNGQINALMMMWHGTCAMPGCTHTRFIEMHHVTEWSEGGPTDLDNLLPLCSACHSLVSEGLVRIIKDFGDVHFLMPGGARFVSRDHSLPVRCDDAITLEEFETLQPV
ncbi:HNH endonuclease signature motif containing protein [Corynebacterium qintianiae]|uniref:HNH endonuclease signature motif containing protein n=1 Tax=Corynebacterium qintianiae TaxID=2709392 RepID=UPI001F30AD98|nr:HNH endonuclease signature motif containing protein [Corynebacterium qintianiae]